MIVMQPVLETYGPDGFGLWPVAKLEPFGFLPLSGRLSSAEVGTAVMRIAGCNAPDPDPDPAPAPDPDPDPDPDGDRPPRPADALDSFLYGLLTFETLFAAVGRRVTDDSTGVTSCPAAAMGWMTGATGTSSSKAATRPVIELPVTELRRLLAGVERDRSARAR
ncbi:hypothetical protein ACFWVF_23665 [Streptomyces sp. NPDC058659]|uniref:hypothetical protein n=1 Tax=unclassified Streptomyces TaxID=2593676 RepID=UPI00364A3F46